MSNASGIAAVTYVLKDLLTDGTINSDLTGNVKISSVAPNLLEKASDTTDKQLNIFLYRVSPNTGWSNMENPSRNSNGYMINRQILALNLHYLLTAYGDSELQTEILLGHGMQILHENPVLKRNSIRNSLKNINDANLSALKNSGLADQAEQVKITPEQLNTEEISKLWSAFQAKYRSCTAYMASVVLIESDKPAVSALPVQQRRIFALPFHHPVIEEILSQSEDDAPILKNQKILTGYRLILKGTQFKNDEVIVRINGVTHNEEDIEDISDTQISLILPDTLKAGLQGVQIIHNQELKILPEKIVEEPARLKDKLKYEKRKVFESNLQAFVLSPKIIDPPPVIVGEILKLNVAPAIHPNQEVILLLNKIGAPDSFSLLLSTSDWDNKKTEIEFNIKDIKAGDYLIRIQVDGADSPLDISDSNILGPKITIP